MSINLINFGILLKESVFGICVMGIVAVINIYSFVWISLAYRATLSDGVFHGKHYEILRYVAYTMLLVLSMLVSLAIWVLALVSFGFISEWLLALLFTASFFTTVGNISINFPFGWRLIPSMIAFSGLFSFAWATGSSMSMASHLVSHFEKHKSN
jgi:hypothetical protein